MYLFLVLTLINVPIVNTYAAYDFFETGSILSYSLGNLGFSDTHCKYFPIKQALAPRNEKQFTGGVHLQCQAGLISELVDFGISTKYEEQLTCSRKVSTQYCDQFLSDPDFRDYFKSQCRTSETCTIDNLRDFFKYETPQ